MDLAGGGGAEIGDELGDVFGLADAADARSGVTSSRREIVQHASRVLVRKVLKSLACHPPSCKQTRDQRKHD